VAEVVKHKSLNSNLSIAKIKNKNKPENTAASQLGFIFKVHEINISKRYLHPPHTHGSVIHNSQDIVPTNIKIPWYV
jgi:hypothetical protein